MFRPQSSGVQGWVSAEVRCGTAESIHAALRRSSRAAVLHGGDVVQPLVEEGVDDGRQVVVVHLLSANVGRAHTCKIKTTTNADWRKRRKMKSKELTNRKELKLQTRACLNNDLKKH